MEISSHPGMLPLILFMHRVHLQVKYVGGRESGSAYRAVGRTSGARDSGHLRIYIFFQGELGF